MPEYVSLAIEALDSPDNHVGWCRDWLDQPDLCPLEPEGWFGEGDCVVAGS